MTICILSLPGVTGQSLKCLQVIDCRIKYDNDKGANHGNDKEFSVIPVLRHRNLLFNMRDPPIEPEDDILCKLEDDKKKQTRQWHEISSWI